MYLVFQAKKNGISQVTYYDITSLQYCLFREWQIFENFEFLNFRSREKRIRKKQLIKEHSANVSVKINGKTGRSQCKNCCY